MTTQFVTTRGILDRAVSHGVISNEERPAFESHLNSYDRALDGRLDGGFGKKQIGPDTYVQIGHPVQKIREKIEKLNRITLSVLNDEKNFELKKSFGQMAGEVAVFGAKVAWAFANPAACGSRCDECEVDVCYEDEEEEIVCGCPPGEEERQDCHMEEVCTGEYGQRCTNVNQCDTICE